MEGSAPSKVEDLGVLPLVVNPDGVKLNVLSTNLSRVVWSVFTKVLVLVVRGMYGPCESTRLLIALGAKDVWLLVYELYELYELFKATPACMETFETVLASLLPSATRLVVKMTDKLPNGRPQCMQATPLESV